MAGQTMADDRPSRVHVDAWGVITRIDPPLCELCGHPHWVNIPCQQEEPMTADEHAAPLSAAEIEAIRKQVKIGADVWAHDQFVMPMPEQDMRRLFATLDAYRAVMADMVALELYAGEYHRDYYSEDEVDALKDHARALLSQE
jgi:hypothetical protein